MLRLLNAILRSLRDAATDAVFISLVGEEATFTGILVLINQTNLIHLIASTGRTRLLCRIVDARKRHDTGQFGYGRGSRSLLQFLLLFSRIVALQNERHRRQWVDRSLLNLLVDSTAATCEIVVKLWFILWREHGRDCMGPLLDQAAQGSATRRC